MSIMLKDPLQFLKNISSLAPLKNASIFLSYSEDAWDFWLNFFWGCFFIEVVKYNSSDLVFSYIFPSLQRPLWIYESFPCDFIQTWMAREAADCKRGDWSAKDWIFMHTPWLPKFYFEWKFKGN